MKIYVEDSEYDEDYGFGYDSNGEPIDESTVQELYRIANYEALPDTELFTLAADGMCEIDEDSFEYYNTGTAFGPHLKYSITMYVNSDGIDINTFSTGKDSALAFNQTGVDAEFELKVHIMISGDTVNVEIVDADAYKNGTHSTFYSNKMKSSFDFDAICEHVKQYAEKASEEIHSAISFM